MLLSPTPIMLQSNPYDPGSLLHAIYGAGAMTGLHYAADAGDIASFPGGAYQQWDNLALASPDFYLGADGAVDNVNPTFNGTPGARTAAEYFGLDGGDWFRIKDGNTAAINDLHKANGKWGVYTVVYQPADDADYGLCGDKTNFNANHAGFALYHEQTTRKLGVLVTSAAADQVNKLSDGALTLNQWTAEGVSINGASGGTGFLWRNGAYLPVGGSNTWSSAYPSPATTPALYPMEIGSFGDNSGRMKSGSRIAVFAMWAGVAPTKAQFDAIHSALGSRWGI